MPVFNFVGKWGTFHVVGFGAQLRKTELSHRKHSVLQVLGAVSKNCPCAKWHAKAAKQNGRSASIPFCWPASLRLICQHRVQNLQNGMVAPQGVRFARLERVTCRTEFWSPECVRSKTGPIRLGTDVREVMHVCAYGDARAS